MAWYSEGVMAKNEAALWSGLVDLGSLCPKQEEKDFLAGAVVMYLEIKKTMDSRDINERLFQGIWRADII